eukprot:5159198-Pleurochrysis_carterae.AAC.2
MSCEPSKGRCAFIDVSSVRLRALLACVLELIHKHLCMTPSACASASASASALAAAAVRSGMKRQRARSDVQRGRSA